jgi:hypothetical protein
MEVGWRGDNFWQEPFGEQNTAAGKSALIFLGE